MKKLHLLVPFVLLFLALGLAACGGGDESDEDKIVDVIETSVTSTDPADCTELMTQNFLEQIQFSEGAEAVESCEENAEETGDNPDSVEVAKVEIEDSAATADVTFAGGSFDGQTFTVALIEEEGDWKLDEIVGFAEFDQDQLASSFEEAFEDEESIEPQVASCIGEVLRELPRAEAEEIAISGSSEPIVELVKGCSQG